MKFDGDLCNSGESLLPRLEEDRNFLAFDVQLEEIDALDPEAIEDLFQVDDFDLRRRHNTAL